jgi:sulfate/thiosulfate transport system ATP-binding protein
VVGLGFETRVELERDDGQRLHAQLTRDEADQLELRVGDIVHIATRNTRTFVA